MSRSSRSTAATSRTGATGSQWACKTAAMIVRMMIEQCNVLVLSRGQNQNTSCMCTNRLVHLSLDAKEERAASPRPPPVAADRKAERPEPNSSELITDEDLVDLDLDLDRT